MRLANIDNSVFERLNRYESALVAANCADGAYYWVHRATVKSSVSENLKHVSRGPLRRAGNVDVRRGSAELNAEIIDKGSLVLMEPRRYRNKDHVRFVAAQPCTVCGRQPSDPPHIRFAQQRALGRKVSDELTVPLCRIHHPELHRKGDEAEWWSSVNIDPIPVALHLWQHSRCVLPDTRRKQNQEASVLERDAVRRKRIPL